MAILTNLRGRVESDPLRVPTAAAMTTGRPERFENVLQQTVEASTPRPEAPTAPAEPPAKKPEPVAEPTSEDEPPAPHAHAGDEAQPTDLAVAHAAADAQVSHAAVPENETIRRGESARQETAGKGTDSPRPSARASAPSVEPLLAATVQYAAGLPGVAAPAEPAAGVAAIGGARTAGPVPTRGLEGLGNRPGAPLRAPAVATGYRTNGAVSAELLEQARDSIFKQIMMKVTGDGGEMRMRLDPPELGELDLRMVVEGGNKLSLSIAAEHQDMTELLQRHLDELKQSLQSAGLEVTSAQVQTRSEFARDQRDEQARQQTGGGHRAELPVQPSSPTPTRGGYISAEGLDFWA